MECPEDFTQDWINSGDALCLQEYVDWQPVKVKDSKMADKNK
jgi:hypothetical protein